MELNIAYSLIQSQSEYLMPDTRKCLIKGLSLDAIQILDQMLFFPKFSIEYANGIQMLLILYLPQLDICGYSKLEESALNRMPGYRLPVCLSYFLQYCFYNFQLLEVH